MQSLVETNRWKWSALAKRVKARDAYRCQLRLSVCTGIATEVDHIRPRAAGGGDELSNLRSVCSPCHKSRGLAETQRPRSYGSAVVTRDYTRGRDGAG